MDFTLYFAPGACSMAPHIILEEVGASFATVKIDLAKGEQRSAAFTAINPRQKVPALKIAGEVLTEDVAILLYLARVFPEKTLMPAGDMPMARAMELMSFLSTTIHVMWGTMLHPGNASADPAHADAIKARARERIAACFDDFEKHVREPYLIGDHFTVADAFGFVFFSWGRRSKMIDEQKTPQLMRWGTRMKERPSIARVLQKEGVALP